METFAIVAELDVPGNIRAGVVAGGVNGSIDPLDLECRVERLRLRIIEAHTGSTYGLAHVESVRGLGEHRAHVLAAAVGVKYRAWGEVVNYPNGLGPLQYAHHFGIDPHNDYLNAFYSNGWLGGVTYPTLVVVTLLVGFRAAMVRTP